MRGEEETRHPSLDASERFTLRIAGGDLLGYLSCLPYQDTLSLESVNLLV